MRPVLDKVLLLFCGGALILLQPLTIASVAAFLTAVTLGALGSVLAKRWYGYVSGIAYVLICIRYPEFCAFLPLVFYDIFSFCHPLFYPLALLPAVLPGNAFSTNMSRTATIFLFLGVSYFLYRRSSMLDQLRKDLLKIRDTGKEQALLLESKNRELMEKQDYEIRLATLAERNRIAREIHDNVGHMLSRSILQVGALLAINKEEAVGNALNGLRDTLSQAMDSIRSSVHDLHDESIDLGVQVQSLIREFTFCPVRLDYDVESGMNKELKYALLSIVKEALSNVARHSGATQVTITLREHPALYQLIIQDNGKGAAGKAAPGIGIQNMADRVDAFHGHLHIDGKAGFKIFISIPKEERAG